jgi:uncharacterized membrane protein YkvA (DUF1232 family)
MSVTINIELSDSDLAHFQGFMEKARTIAGEKNPAEIVDAASQLLAKASTTSAPDFIRERLGLLDSLIAMVRDEAWALPKEDCDRVLSTLVYFAGAADAIPDEVPVVGFLDDAIMIEICSRELRHEIEAYEDFCEYRQMGAERRGLSPEAVGRAEWLEGRREELQTRMHRRARDFGIGYGSSSGYGRASYTRSWRPGLFKFS